MADALRFQYLMQKGAMLRPQMPLLLTYREHSIEAMGLLDSGADVNVLPYSLGTALGARWEDQRTLVQLSGNLANYEARGILITATVGNLPSVQLAFAWTQATDVPLLLGQVNFFLEFDVCFFRAQSAFEVRPKQG